MNSGWFKLKLKQDLSEAVRLNKRLSFSFAEGTPSSNRLCGSEQHSGSGLLNAKYLGLKKGLKGERMSSLVCGLPRNNPFSQRSHLTMTHAIRSEQGNDSW